MLTVPDAAKLVLLDRLMLGIDPWYHLFAVDVWPDSATTLAQLTEPDWSGYAPIRVNIWAPAVIVNGMAQTTADPAEWTRGAPGDPQTVYGYYVTLGETGPLLWAEHVCGSPGISMETDGDVCVIWPLVDLSQIIGEPCQPTGGFEFGGV